jgi:hypothetical protein
LVVAPLADRIVQRAILDVLQGAKELEGVQAVLATPTSIGGIPKRGVDCAIELIEQASQAGYRYAAGSDIRNFFTKISKQQVIDFLFSQVPEPDFIGLLERALTVELCNADQMSAEDLHMFPTGTDGVAQGCPLSALAGNIVLREFDKQMNDPDRGLICIRYIDDFLVLGRNLGGVQKGMAAAKLHLQTLKMDTYEPKASPNKAFIGPLAAGHVFLGHALVPGRYPPSQAAQDKLKRSIEQLVRDGQKAIDKAVAGRKLKPSDRTFAATLVAISNTLQGWKGSFRSSNCLVTLNELDTWVHRRSIDFESYFHTHTHRKPAKVRDMALGIMPLVPATAA